MIKPNHEISWLFWLISDKYPSLFYKIKSISVWSVHYGMHMLYNNSAELSQIILIAQITLIIQIIFNFLSD